MLVNLVSLPKYISRKHIHIALIVSWSIKAQIEHLKGLNCPILAISTTKMSVLSILAISYIYFLSFSSKFVQSYTRSLLVSPSKSSYCFPFLQTPMFSLNNICCQFLYFKDYFLYYFLVLNFSLTVLSLVLLSSLF